VGPNTGVDFWRREKCVAPPGLDARIVQSVC